MAIRPAITNKACVEGRRLLAGKTPETLTQEEYEIFADALIDYLDELEATSDERDRVAKRLGDVPR